MKYRALALFPFFALAAFLVALALTPLGEHGAVYRFEVEFAKTVALVGCAAAALRFGRGDYLRNAWLLLGQCYLLILVNDVVFRPGLGAFGHEPWAAAVSGIVVLVANLGGFVGTVMLARVWRVAGFELAGSPLVRRAVVAAMVAIALAAAGDLVYTSARAVAHGQTASLNDLFSSIADIASFVLIAPFLLTAIALRGGSLSWTWGLFTASLLGWLLFDAALSFGTIVATNGDAVRRVSESARLLACTFGMSAGLAQRLAVRAPAPAALAAARG